MPTEACCSIPLLKNAHNQFACKNVYIKGEEPNHVLQIPIAHGEGRYYIDAEGLADLSANNQIIYRYCNEEGDTHEIHTPNGSLNGIAGICNKERNVFGMMPHPERVFRTVSNSWHPAEWGEDSPWMRIFRNARKQLG